mmetsp:Transcript_617/g.2255  ORF Transcript_617/g.2255 Transcript_617/m.2255 type:complete len:200 (+) Transcript_617:188-787(+)
MGHQVFGRFLGHLAHAAPCACLLTASQDERHDVNRFLVVHNIPQAVTPYDHGLVLWPNLDAKHLGGCVHQRYGELKVCVPQRPRARQRNRQRIVCHPPTPEELDSTARDVDPMLLGVDVWLVVVAQPMGEIAALEDRTTVASVGNPQDAPKLQNGERGAPIPCVLGASLANDLPVQLQEGTLQAAAHRAMTFPHHLSRC